MFPRMIQKMISAFLMKLETVAQKCDCSGYVLRHHDDKLKIKSALVIFSVTFALK